MLKFQHQKPGNLNLYKGKDMCIKYYSNYPYIYILCIIKLFFIIHKLAWTSFKGAVEGVNKTRTGGHIRSIVNQKSSSNPDNTKMLSLPYIH